MLISGIYCGENLDSLCWNQMETLRGKDVVETRVSVSKCAYHVRLSVLKIIIMDTVPKYFFGGIM